MQAAAQSRRHTAENAGAPSFRGPQYGYYFHADYSIPHYVNATLFCLIGAPLSALSMPRKKSPHAWPIC